MLALLIKQPANIWKSLELRHKIEALLLFVLIYAFMATRLNTLFASWLEDGATELGTTLLVSNLFTLLLTFSSVLILRWFIPKQKGINIFISSPLDNRQVAKILFYYSFKYLSSYLILFLPIITALAVSFGLYPAILSTLIIVLVSYSYLMIFFRLGNRYKAGASFVFYGFLTSLIYHGLFSSIYWWTEYAHIFQIIVLILATSLIILLNKDKRSILLLENFTTYKKKEIINPQISNHKILSIANVFPDKVQALFEKEIYSLWRNRYYKKLKIQSFSIFIVLSLIVINANVEYRGIWLVVVTCFTIWLHYSNNFNEKYMISDPEWFIRTLPIRFRHLFFAKYFAEIAFVFLLILCDVVFLQFSGTSVLIQFYNLAFVFVFAHLVLFTMLNFQIMFYDNTRLAAYAYHFSLLFIVIMILNYRLVGPVIALGLLIFFLYKNVKYFNN